MVRRPVLALLDRFLYRHPFEGVSARRYARDERPAFGDLDDRLVAELAPLLGGARRLLDVGCGPGTFAELVAAKYPAMTVVAIDPSRDFAREHTGCRVARAAGEALPLADATIDVAMCLSSIRHVRDRHATLAELRRVVRGTLVIVELDPDADADRIATHADALGSPILRRAFGPFVVRTAPHADAIVAIAEDAGWQLRALRADPIQPVYIMELQ
jgi:ubiquinone/menaquinone biosynthesis C-methylase UbiE